VTLIRIAAAYEPRPVGFARFHRAGRLTFTDAELRQLLTLLDGPAVLAIEPDRPAVIPELWEAASTVLAFCGATDAALLDVIFGVAKPEGRLPFDLPTAARVSPGSDRGWRPNWPAAAGRRRRLNRSGR
jgi:beta-glucosidase